MDCQNMCCVTLNFFHVQQSSGLSEFIEFAFWKQSTFSLAYIAPELREENKVELVWSIPHRILIDHVDTAKDCKKSSYQSIVINNGSYEFAFGKAM